MLVLFRIIDLNHNAQRLVLAGCVNGRTTHFTRYNRCGDEMEPQRDQERDDGTKHRRQDARNIIHKAFSSAISVGMRCREISTLCCCFYNNN